MRWTNDIAMGYSAERYELSLEFVVVTVERNIAKSRPTWRQRWHWSVQAIHDKVNWRQYGMTLEEKTFELYEGGWLSCDLDKDSAQKSAERAAHRAIKKHVNTAKKVIAKANREAERRLRKLQLDWLWLIPRKPITRATRE